MSEENEIYALKVGASQRDKVFASLKNGVGRFGWSYVETADLRALKERIEHDGWSALTEEEADCYQEFLLNFETGDYVVYINLPDYGNCTLAKLTGDYYWEWKDKDLNHRFPVDPESIQVFDRNDSAVHPALSARLKLQGRWWRIYTRAEFQQLLESIDAGRLGSEATQAHRLALLGQEIRPLLGSITASIHHTHPNYSLEELVEEVLRAMPSVQEVNRQGGAGDHGADIIAVVEESHPITGAPRQTTYVIQVKSFSGQHKDVKAVDDIRRAFEKYPSADEGIIVSTAVHAARELEEDVDQLQHDTGKEVHLLIGEDVAAFILRNGWEILKREVGSEN